MRVWYPSASWRGGHIIPGIQAEEAEQPEVMRCGSVREPAVGRFRVMRTGGGYLW
jgi:hypothetical protein